MKKSAVIALSLVMLSGCQAIWDQYHALHPDFVPVDPSGDLDKIACDEQCKADLRAYAEAERKKPQTRVPQSYDTYEYQVQINGKTVTCRPGLNTGFVDGINHNVECK